MVIRAFDHVTFALPDGHSGAGQPSVELHHQWQFD